MLKVLDEKYITEMGFVKEGRDYTCYGYVDGERKIAFRIYAGSLYVRQAKTNYILDEQIKLIYDWIKAGYVEWED